jgi:hypothetical protein
MRKIGMREFVLYRYRHCTKMKGAEMQQPTTSAVQPVLAAVLQRVRARIAAEHAKPDTVRAAHSASIPERH